LHHRSGILADLVYLVICKVLQTRNEKIELLHNCLLTILENLSPYVDRLGQTASLRLVKLFEAMVSPRYVCVCVCG
jgi:hypothetical protein